VISHKKVTETTQKKYGAKAGKKRHRSKNEKTIETKLRLRRLGGTKHALESTRNGTEESTKGTMLKNQHWKLAVKTDMISYEKVAETTQKKHGAKAGKKASFEERENKGCTKFARKLQRDTGKTRRASWRRGHVRQGKNKLETHRCQATKTEKHYKGKKHWRNNRLKNIL
jgi:hypothetical protein